MRRLLPLAALALAACLVYSEDLLEPADDDGSGGASSQSGMGGMPTSSTTGMGGDTSTSTATTTSTTSMMASTTTTGPGNGGGGQGGEGGGGGGAGGQGGQGGGGAVVVWLNELHYDNNGGDQGEGVEVAGTAGASLSDYRIEFYNGSNPAAATLYDTELLGGTIPDQSNGFGTVWFPISGIQNGTADGLALIHIPTNAVLQHISYEGVHTVATGQGAAEGLTSIDMGVDEPDTTPVGQSLQLMGTGSDYADFTWAAPATATPGAPNNNQTLL